MDKNLLNEYMDACELIKETETDIYRLRQKKNLTDAAGDGSCHAQEMLLEERRACAEDIKIKVEAWTNTVPVRMQRIIRYKFFEGLSWEETARRMGRSSTEGSIKMEFQRFMRKK